jgi:hypothetical protein
MPDFLKTPYVYSATSLAAQRAAHMAALVGKGLPCRVVEVLIGPIVTVAFEVNSLFTLPNLTMPVSTSQYVRPSITVGDLGRATPTGAQVATVSGLGSGTADFGLEGNLGTLVFEPLTNGKWSAQPGGLTSSLFQGTNGAVLQDLQGKAVVNCNATDGISLAFGGHSIQITAANVIIDGKPFLPHTHSGVTTGSSDTGGVA